ncbi:MAG: hypothetical protein K6E79_00450, partial [Pseudobutyrivibrio sp.]|nr:hypothetical protein [Pseudobutyrivibrio sp.]
MKKKSVKALAIGLSAVTIASSVDMTALAAEIPAEEPETNQDSQSQENNESVPAMNQGVVDSIDGAQKAIGDAKEADSQNPIDTNLSNSDAALAEVEDDIKALDELNKKANDAVQEYEKTVNDDNQGVVDGDATAAQS